MAYAITGALENSNYTATARKSLVDLVFGLLSVSRYHALNKDVEALMRSSDEELSRMDLRRDEVTHHVARKYQLID